MEHTKLTELLNKVAQGEVSVEKAALELKTEPFEDLGFAKLDHHRKIRQGAAEVIYGAGKTPEQILKITEAFRKKGDNAVLITRMSQEAADLVGASLPLRYDALSRTGIVGELPEKDGNGKVVIATGGTSDLPVAEEAALTAEVLGNEVVRIYDVGVAGIHRLLAYSEDLMSAQVIVVVAGMEGALASVVGGLADCPVIAVPTSVGYGASFGGLSALLSMLNSCASGQFLTHVRERSANLSRNLLMKRGFRKNLPFTIWSKNWHQKSLRMSVIFIKVLVQISIFTADLSTVCSIFRRHCTHRFLRRRVL